MNDSNRYFQNTEAFPHSQIQTIPSNLRYSDFDSAEQKLFYKTFQTLKNQCLYETSESDSAKEQCGFVR